MDLSVGSKQEGCSVNEVRDYRKGNWTVQETMVLIEAKKMDEERRLKRPCHGGERGKPPELRWKWVEDYCWRRGCFRSQNQCNDKWDNLMRDFKKVREYEGRAAEAGGGAAAKSYWKIEKNERKEKSLPSNLLSEIYEALMELTERKSQRFASVLGQQPSLMPHQLQEPLLTQAAPPTHPSPPFPTAAEQPTLAFSQPLPTGQIVIEAAMESRSRRRRREERGKKAAEGVG